MLEFIADESSELDSNFEHFHVHYWNCPNEPAPVRNKRKKELKFAMKPWISQSLKRSILERARLYRLSRIPHPDQNQRKTKYNRYKKKLEKALFAAENNFFARKLDESQNQSRQIWKIINNITKRKKQTKNTLHKLKLDNGNFVDKSKDIANVFNQFLFQLALLLLINYVNLVSPLKVT